MRMDIIKNIIEREESEQKKYKPITVNKHLDVRNDLGMLLCSDPNDLDEEEITQNKEEYLKELTRDNVQLLLNDIWQLPTERFEECIVAKLPASKTILPRIRKVPGPKPLTKWEKFAKEKGIKKKKRDKKIYDQELDKWVPTYGYKRVQAEKQKDWVIEVPKNADPMEDMFQKKADLRSEKVTKNEIQRMKNIVRAKKEELPRAGFLGPDSASSTQLLAAVSIAKASTASVGKFQGKIANEKPARGLGLKELIPGTKRKASHVTQVSEKEESLELIKSVINKKPKLNIEKAISLQKHEEKLSREENQTTSTKSSKKSKLHKKGKRSMKKPKGGRGQRAPGKKGSIGRKRR